MTSRTLGFAALLASVAITSTVQAQIELNDSNTGVVISLRPQSGVLVASQEASKNDPPATESADKQDPDKPADKDAEDAKEQDKKEDPDLDTPKSAGGSTPANGSDAGRLNPIAMESVRAPIGAANIAVADIGTKVLPEDQAAKLMNARMPLPGGQDRVFCGLTYRWQAANICHFPLYFEEPMLERHGQQCCPTWIQPAVSGTKFLSNVILYPYKATLHPAFENRYTLGHFRPGSGAPCLRDTLPWSADAALVQAGATTAVFVGLPW